MEEFLINGLKQTSSGRYWRTPPQQGKVPYGSLPSALSYRVARPAQGWESRKYNSCGDHGNGTVGWPMPGRLGNGRPFVVGNGRGGTVRLGTTPGAVVWSPPPVAFGPGTGVGVNVGAGVGADPPGWVAPGAPVRPGAG